MNDSTLRSWLVSVSMVVTVVACGGVGAYPTAAPPSPAATAVRGPTAEPSAAATAGASTASAPTAEPTSGTISLKAYFLLFGNVDGPTPLVPVSREFDGTVAVARAAMEQLARRSDRGRAGARPARRDDRHADPGRGRGCSSLDCRRRRSPPWTLSGELAAGH